MVYAGCCMASFDKFVIRVRETAVMAPHRKGRGPHQYRFPYCDQSQEIVAREIAATKPAVLTIGHMEAGFA
ncbi:MAG: hypothetical protein ACLU8D_09680 [Enterocloster sp.]